MAAQSNLFQHDQVKTDRNLPAYLLGFPLEYPDHETEDISINEAIKQNYLSQMIPLFRSQK